MGSPTFKVKRTTYSNKENGYLFVVNLQDTACNLVLLSGGCRRRPMCCVLLTVGQHGTPAGDGPLDEQ